MRVGSPTVTLSTLRLILHRLIAANISFHILFPTITIAMCWFLVYFKVRHEISGEPVWMRVYRFWVKVFALTFALGVVSGITMSFQFSTNWPGFMETVGNIAGPLLGYEVLTAFFLEAIFLGVMLFGMDRISSKLHTFSTIMVAIGTTFSAFWILALNSWMHTPTGFEMRDGVAFPVDWWAIIFNPSFPYRLSHMLLASALTASFFIAGISAYRLLKGDTKRAPRVALKTGLLTAALIIPLQIFVGDMHGLNTLEHQPQKVAAMEGHWETKKGVPLVLFGIPNEETRSNDYEVSIPKLTSLILTHDLNGEVQGLNDFEGNHPPVKPVFFSFRVMIGTGLLMLLVSWAGVYTLRKKKELPRWMLRVVLAMTFSGWVATLAGWYVTETGRQPWLVTGILKTADAVTPIAASHVGFTLAMYCTVYVVLMWAYFHTLISMAKRAVEVKEYAANESPRWSKIDNTNAGKNEGVAQ